jgi:hypothetical protein
MGRKFEVEWADFGIAVSMELLDGENPELCEAFWPNVTHTSSEFPYVWRH